MSRYIISNQMYYLELSKITYVITYTIIITNFDNIVNYNTVELVYTDQLWDRLTVV